MHELKQHFANLKIKYYRILNHLAIPENLKYYHDLANNILRFAQRDQAELLDSTLRANALGGLIKDFDSLQAPQGSKKKRILDMLVDKSEQNHENACHLVALLLVGHEKEKVKDLAIKIKSSG